MERLVTQAKEMAEEGVKELILVAQETTVYGTDIYGKKSLHILLKELCKIKGIRWIRVLYCYPEEIYDELIQTMKEEKKICHYLDLPIQHASDRILKRMGRRTTQAELVGLGHRKDSKLSQLSGGEQQRVAIAIALANNPKLLLADEPTGAVDRKTADDILEMFRKLNEKLGLTIVIVTHDKELAKKVNRVVSIRDGKTSSERIMKNDYRERMEHLDIDWQEEETQEEFAVLDRAGRVQIPSELLEQMGMDGNKVKLEFIGGKIVIEKPKD